MNFWPRRNPARELARLSADKRRCEALTQREKILATARQMRAEMKMPPDPALEAHDA